MTTDPASRVALHSGGTVAELVARLRTEGRVYTHMEAADLIERLHAEREKHDTPAWEANERLNGLVERLCQALEKIAETVNDPRLMQRWDDWRLYAAKGGTASWPRDEFEALIDSIATEAQDALAPAEGEKTSTETNGE